MQLVYLRLRLLLFIIILLLLFLHGDYMTIKHVKISLIQSYVL